MAAKWIKEDIQCWTEDALKYMNLEKLSVHEEQTGSLVMLRFEGSKET